MPRPVITEFSVAESHRLDPRRVDADPELEEWQMGCIGVTTLRAGDRWH